MVNMLNGARWIVSPSSQKVLDRLEKKRLSRMRPKKKGKKNGRNH